MNSRPQPALETARDVGEYCRRVEAHLARVNEGHIIRIAGTAFALVRDWAREGIPLAVVCRGIEQKAERHRTGRSKRALRLEFCEADVRALYDEWRRAVGVWTPDGASSVEAPATGEPGETGDERRRPSVVRELDRAIDRLSAAAGRLERPDAFRDQVAQILAEAVQLRDAVRRVRGDARRALAPRAAELDRAIAAAARAAGPDVLAGAEEEAAAELAPFRGRLAPAAWQRSIDTAVDRLLRSRCGLPVIDPAWLAPGGTMEPR